METEAKKSRVIEKKRERERKREKKIEKKITKIDMIKKLKGRLRRSLHLLVRVEESYMNKDGEVVYSCVSCGRILPFAKMTAGHFFEAKRFPSLRFERLNIHGQCVACNRFLHGNLVPYTMWMQERYGCDMVDYLIQRSREPAKNWTVEALQNEIKLVEDRLHALVDLRYATSKGRMNEEAILDAVIE